MLGLSLYPHHLRDGSDCSLESFCQMAADTAEKIGVAALGIGKRSLLRATAIGFEWMRSGRWTKERDYGEGDG